MLFCRTLMNNLLVCDCHLSWMLQLPDSISVQNAVCMEPATLRGQNLLTVAATSLDQLCPGISRFIVVSHHGSV